MAISLLIQAGPWLSAAECPGLYGIHDHTPDPSEYLNHIANGGGASCGWVTATVAVGHDPNDTSGEDFSTLADRGHTVICRLNNGYFPNGTIPVPAQYDNFAARCAQFVAHSSGCHIWVVGNELNIRGEWPFDGARFNYVSPQSYAVCFRKVSDAIKAVHPEDKILSAPLAPWAGPYGASTLNGYPADGMAINWVQYLNQMLTAIAASGPLDGIALHINSRGYGYADIHSTSRVTANGQSLYFSFYVYKDWIDYGIPSSLYHLPLYATECNGYYFWSGGHSEAPTEHYEPGWVQEIYAEIDRHNQAVARSGLPVFRCVNLYRWCGSCDGWNIDASPYKSQILADLDAAVARNYTRPPVPTRVPLLPAGSVWRYRDDGSNQGTAWRMAGFNDTSWSAGLGQLGYGDGDERTVINGGPSDNRHITTYFRHAFELNTLGFITNLTLRLLRDDGAAVYLNGTEVFRSNLPGGTISYTTLASSALSGAAEDEFVVTSVNPILLRAGTNVVAVEVHQANATSSDVSFDLDLFGVGNLPPGVALTQPGSGSVMGAGNDLVLRAEVDDPEGAQALVAFYANDQLLGQDGAPPYELTWIGVPEGLHRLTAVAVDPGTLRGTSAPVMVLAQPALVRAGSVWKYQNSGVDLGVAWRGMSYPDASWPSGPAQLGFGDGDEATVINGGPSGNRYSTIYFRHHFNVAAPAAFTNLLVRLLRDDGAVVYLNGAEVFRSNMPGGTIGYTTLAPSTATDQDESTLYHTRAVNAALLRPGDNVLAVEVHQSSLGSSDLSFDLELLGARDAAPPPLWIGLVDGGTGLQLSWPSFYEGYSVEATPRLDDFPDWFQVSESVVISNDLRTMIVPVTGAKKFFRLRKP